VTAQLLTRLSYFGGKLVSHSFHDEYFFQFAPVRACLPVGRWLLLSPLLL
jgi:hypothetical protein